MQLIYLYINMNYGVKWKWKKMIILVLMFMSLMLILIGCSHSKQQTQKKDYKPEVLNVEFVPSQHSETLNAKSETITKITL